jgi:hypothetical protein
LLAEDFGTGQSLRIEGILYVFLDSQTAEMGRKIRQHLQPIDRRLHWLNKGTPVKVRDTAARAEVL